MLDLPSGLLSRVLSAVHEQESRRCLFGACKLLRDVTLAEANGVQCLIDVSIVTPTQAARSLQLLDNCREGAEVKLVLQDARTEPDRVDERYTAQFMSWLNTLCLEHGTVLEPLTHVDLKAHVYGGLVPDGLQACCPKMTHLSRLGCIKNLPNTPATDAHVCLQLRHLSLLDLGPIDWDDKHNMSVEQLQQQFSLLPNLQSLSCTLQPSSNRKYTVTSALLSHRAAAYLMSSIQPMHSHLKALTLPKGPEFMRVVPVLCVNAWTQLTQLIMLEVDISDECMDLLLSKAPQVAELHVREMSVRTSFAGRECQWRQLTVRTIHCSSMARLPIGKLSSLRLQSISINSEDWSCMQSVTSTLSGVHMVEAVEQTFDIINVPGCDISESQVQVLVALLQVVRHGQIALTYWGSQVHLWFPVLEQIQCHHLTLYTDNVPEDCWGTMLQQLPRLESLCIMHIGWPVPDPVAWLDGLAMFCGHAQRAFALHIDSKLAEVLAQDWQERLVSSMHAAGHQHVTIQTQP